MGLLELSTPPLPKEMPPSLSNLIESLAGWPDGDSTLQVVVVGVAVAGVAEAVWAAPSSPAPNAMTTVPLPSSLMLLRRDSIVSSISVIELGHAPLTCRVQSERRPLATR